MKIPKEYYRPNLLSAWRAGISEGMERIRLGIFNEPTKEFLDACDAIYREGAQDERLHIQDRFELTKEFMSENEFAKVYEVLFGLRPR